MNAGAYLFYVWPVAQPSQCGCRFCRWQALWLLQDSQDLAADLHSLLEPEIQTWSTEGKNHEKHTYELCMYRLTLQIPTKKIQKVVKVLRCTKIMV